MLALRCLPAHAQQETIHRSIEYASSKPSQTNTLESKAVAAFEKGDFKIASGLLNRVTKLDPRNSLAFYFLGQSLEQEDNQPEAISAYRSGLLITGEGSDLAPKIHRHLDLLTRPTIVLLIGLTGSLGQHHIDYPFYAGGRGESEALTAALAKCHSNVDPVMAFCDYNSKDASKFSWESRYCWSVAIKTNNPFLHFDSSAFVGVIDQSSRSIALESSKNAAMNACASKLSLEECSTFVSGCSDELQITRDLPFWQPP